MTHEAAREMDRKRVWDWLSEVYISPSLSYDKYTDEEIREFAHDALVLLKEQEPVKPTYEDFFGNRIARCGKCNGYIVRYKYCPGCGQKVKWNE